MGQAKIFILKECLSGSISTYANHQIVSHIETEVFVLLNLVIEEFPSFGPPAYRTDDVYAFSDQSWCFAREW
jgi:hypothetical protein